MNITKALSETYNLSSYEAKIYATLTVHGPLLVAKLADVANIPRTAVYPPLLSLIAKGLVAKSNFGKRTYYEATPPETLKTIFEKKRESLDGIITSLNESRRVASKDANLDAALYVGAEGIKSAGLIFLNETKEKMWYSFENLALVADTVGVNFEDSYIRERVARGIKSKMILSITDESPAVRRILQEDKKQLRDTILLSPHMYPFDTTVVATKGLALIIQPHGNPYALLVRSPHLASTFISMHQCIWDRYRHA